MPVCPLCESGRVRLFSVVRGKVYWRCSGCRLTFMDAGHRPGPARERAEYALHQNRPEQAGYRAFLWQLAGCLIPRLRPGARGLDYGCGPGSVLAEMLGARGFRMAVYDPFFAPCPEALARRYDFITCSETAEHFFHPGRAFRRLNGLLRPGGWLGVMTGMPGSDEGFADWHYVRDPTHVCFYGRETMRWIARRFGWRAVFSGERVVLFYRPGGDVRADRSG